MHATRLPILAIAAMLALNVSGAPVLRQPLPVDLGRPIFNSAGTFVSADFNGDTYPDLASPHANGTLYVTPSNATGPFGPMIVNATGVLYMGSMVAGDVDGDGDQDLICLAQVAVKVLLNNGSGVFTAGTETSTIYGGTLAVGDVNGDGKLDAVTATSLLFGDGAELAVHLGNGSGGFGAPVKTPAANSSHHARRLTLADVTGDGRPEIIVSSTQTYVYGASSVGALQYKWSGVGGEVAVGRLNGDAHVDLAVHGMAGDSSTLFGLLGQGNGQFTQTSTTWTPNGSYSKIACGDFTGDQVNDILVTGSVLAVMRGLGNGSFAAPLVTTGSSGAALATGDFDRDGKRDAVTASNDSTKGRFHRGNGDGTFREDRAYIARNINQESFGVSALDMNGDGRADATTFQRNITGTKDIAVMRNDGSGGLLPAVITPTTVPSATEAIFRAGKINGDNWPDVLVITGGNPGVVATTYLGNGNATFTQSSSRALTWTFDSSDPAIQLADVTGDGATDLLVERGLYEGNGDGSFDDIRTPGVLFRALGDIDGNGTLDVIWRGSESELLVMALNTGGGNFTAPAFFGGKYDEPHLLGDFDGDGKRDLLCTTLTGTRVYGGNGNGTFRAAVDVLVASLDSPNDAMHTADFDGDGDLDVSFGADVLLGNGDGRFRHVELDEWSDSGAPTAVADFDANGSPDIVGFLGSLAYVHLTRLVPEPAQTTTITVTASTAPEHAVPVEYVTTTMGGSSSAPIDGVVLHTMDGVPVALTETFSRTNGPSSVKRTFALPAGEHDLAARFLGSAIYLPSSAGLDLTVDRATTSLVATPSYSWTYGSTMTLYWQLQAPTSSGFAVPSTTAYALKEGDVAVPNLQWSASSVQINGLATGSHTLTLEFLGDDNYKPSSHTFTTVVAKHKPSASYAFAPANRDRVEGPVAVTMILSPPASGTVTGTVTFSLDGVELGSAPLVNNRATATTQHLMARSYMVKMQYSGDANNEPVSYSTPMTVYLAPGSVVPVVATAYSGGGVFLSWPPAADATGYVLYMLISNGWGWRGLATVSGDSVTGGLPLPAGTTRAYAVAVRRANGTTGPIGPPDLATSISFTNKPVVPGMLIRATDITELRTAVNSVRAFAGLSAFSFTDTTLMGAGIRALHLTELRDALTQARNAVGMPMAFSPQAPVVGGPVLSSHVEEIRAGVQ
jgi:hypothetical protein